MNLNCKHCNTLVLAEDINLNNMLAKCRRCNSVFSFAGEVANPAQSAMPIGFAQDRQRPRVPIPNGVTVENMGNKLTLTQKWFSWKYIPMVFFCVVWDSFLLFWYSMAFGGNAPIIFLLFPMIHVAVGVGLTYLTIAGFLNSSILEVTREELSIQHRPLPWFGNKTIPIMNITQLFSEEKISHTKNGTSRAYSLNLVTRDGRKESLLSGLDSPDIALFIEQQIESWLHITDKPVGGELSRY